MPDPKHQIEKIFKELDACEHLSRKQYIEDFVKALQKIRFFPEEHEEISKYTRLLNKDTQELFIYDIHTKDDLIERLISLLNIANNSSQTLTLLEYVDVLNTTLIKVFEEVSSEYLKQENPLLFSQAQPRSLEDTKSCMQAWGKVIEDKKHIKIQKYIATIIAMLIEPCVMECAPELKDIIHALHHTPNAITDTNTLKILEELAKHRQEDCKLLKKSSKEIGTNAREVLSELEGVIHDNNKHIKDILKIKDSINEKTSNIQKQKEALMDTANNLHSKILQINTTLKNKEEKIKHLYDEINALSAYIKTIEEQSKIDDLTKTYNRKYIENIAQILEGQFKDNGINYAVLFFDIDNFKEINDIYGHTAGDRLLSIFGEILKQNSRGTDIIGRYGGDEFLILMPNTDLEKAKGFAKRICKIIEKSNFIFKSQKINITTSIGMTDRISHKSKYDMIDSADKLLYQAKNLGRNRVEWQ
ncbi:hypothetical protein BKH46_02440 [Helicobacter sp. 12S02634-8]|uniref:diguanylate cyclase n=1 Tax=Helicobacter sp. 12S02634-8 TaxID=1476199 RepID=UPI000BA7878B|nr:diguanylate cyclase [Helicobacter sp. 12S02634-8]PAF48184.1 hypothetical protein BKH46_02440 [Helicobacter sp. 12S02634-8]